jgi:DNA-directed RNA polymerase subunit RPC12/RpoP
MTDAQSERGIDYVCSDCGVHFNQGVAVGGECPVCGVDRIEISERQRERLEEIKQECTPDGRFSKPSDSDIIDLLLDLCEGVDQELYTSIEQEAGR